MEGLWTGLYVAMLLFGGGFLLIQMMMGQLNELGHDHGAFEAHDHDFGDGMDHDIGHDGAHDVAHHHHGSDATDALRLSFLTPLVLTPAMAAVGVTGLVFSLLLGLPTIVHLPIALLVGAVIHLTVRTILTRMMGMQGSSEVRVDRLWGTLAEVTTPIPANQLGEIRYVANGAYHTSPARTVDGEALPRGQLVLIERVDNSIAMVRPSSP